MGKLFDETGAPLTPSHAVKSGRRYRYYVSRTLIAGSGKSSANTQTNGWRLPAGEIERIVQEAIKDLLADRAALTHVARESGIAVDRVPGLLNSAARWQGKGQDLVERVHLDAGAVAISLNLPQLTRETGTIRHVVPARIKRRGVEMRLVLKGAGPGAAAPKPDASLIKAVARAHKWFDDLASGRAPSIAALVKTEDCSARYVSRLMPLAFLAHEIVEAIVAGTQSVDLTAETLTKRADLS